MASGIPIRRRDNREVSIRWTNLISNTEPDLLGICPLHPSPSAKDGRMFLPMQGLSTMAGGGPGKHVASERESDLRKIVGSPLIID
jgi:hypothetical protein